MDRDPPTGVLYVQEADLFGSHDEQPELIVFNPPWLRGVPRNPIDQAIYYEEPLFERFFESAHSRIAAGGRLVLLFSTLQQTAHASAPHPIQDELDRGGRFSLVDIKRHRVQAASPKTKRRKRDPGTEFVELWELAPTS